MAYVLEKTQRSINFNKSKLPVYVVWVDPEELYNPIVKRIDEDQVDGFSPLAFFTDYGDALDCLSTLLGEPFIADEKDLIEEGFETDDTPIKSDKFAWGEELDDEDESRYRSDDDDLDVDLVDLFNKRGR